ncbi:hypothetical protein Psi01_01490 [Planobispora siamensis]|uniref:Uncharacterized protein n=1 Tax=Planobispora siamensis TaxID=936338 RepID=A0A8J3S9Y2_9ACTN|nr:hypothetical protein Psi01_01490 [Planobispora siamensis]
MHASMATHSPSPMTLCNYWKVSMPVLDQPGPVGRFALTKRHTGRRTSRPSRAGRRERLRVPAAVPHGRTSGRTTRKAPAQPYDTKTRRAAVRRGKPGASKAPGFPVSRARVR